MEGLRAFLDDNLGRFNQYAQRLKTVMHSTNIEWLCIALFILGFADRGAR